MHYTYASDIAYAYVIMLCVYAEALRCYLIMQHEAEKKPSYSFSRSVTNRSIKERAEEGVKMSRALQSTRIAENGVLTRRNTMLRTKTCIRSAYLNPLEPRTSDVAFWKSLVGVILRALARVVAGGKKIVFRIYCPSNLCFFYLYYTLFSKLCHLNHYRENMINI